MATDRRSLARGAGIPDRHDAGPMTRPWQRVAARGALALFIAAVLVNVSQGAVSGALLGTFLLGYAGWQFRRLGLV